MRFQRLILLTAFLFAIHWTPSSDPDSRLTSISCLGTRLLRGDTLKFNAQSGYIYFMEHRLKTDLSTLFRIAEEIVNETRLSNRSADYKQVSHAANRICKLANRIKSGITLGNLPEEEKVLSEDTLTTPSPELLRSQVDELNRLVYKIRCSASRRSKNVIDAKLQQEFYAEVDTLRILASQVKVNADELLLKGE